MRTMKTCHKCKHKLPIESFAMKTRGGKPMVTVSCSECRKSATSRQVILKRTVSSHRNRARNLGVPDSANTFSVADWENILAKSGGQCYYCRKVFHPDELTVEHLVPFVKGGTNTPDNIVAACWRCNVSKGRQTKEEYNTARQFNCRLDQISFLLIDKLTAKLAVSQADIIKIALRDLASKMNVEIPDRTTMT